MFYFIFSIPDVRKSYYGYKVKTISRYNKFNLNTIRSSIKGQYTFHDKSSKFQDWDVIRSIKKFSLPSNVYVLEIQNTDGALWARLNIENIIKDPRVKYHGLIGPITDDIRNQVKSALNQISENSQTFAKEKAIQDEYLTFLRQSSSYYTHKNITSISSELEQSLLPVKSALYQSLECTKEIMALKDKCQYAMQDITHEQEHNLNEMISSNERLQEEIYRILGV